VLSPQGRQAAASRLDIESGLRRAIARDELVLHYQPEVGAQDRRLRAVEALVRWEHPTRGLLAPKDFLPVAERAGLIVEIGNWVIEKAVADAALWRRDVRGAEAVGVSVNLSSQHVGDLRLLDTVGEALRRAGLPAGLLTLEITEDVMLGGAEDILEALQALRSYGVGLTVDDFGTGFSALAYLCALPVQALKLDHDFAAQVTDGERIRTMVANIVTLAHELELGVTAEGVESEQQAAVLSGIGVDRLQGFHVGLPVDVHALVAELPALLG
jgi:EAL domain-containing protein (putative c-di-GMP-specific phosphodiesterase class I)